MKAIKYGLIFAGLFVVYELMASKKAGASTMTYFDNQYPAAWGDYWTNQKTMISDAQKKAIETEILKGNIKFI